MAADEPQDDRTQTYIALTAGTLVSHYKIINKIGAGGMGEVYLAQDTQLDRKVALKFLPPHLCQDEDCRARFKREAQAAAKLDHPNIISVYEVSEYQGRPYFAMAHVEGKSLKEFSAGKDLAIEQILELAIQICGGLHAAHEEGVTHRDIKPSNILIDSYGRARIVDFGLAAVKDADQLTKTGSTMGTIGYMSPEQVQGREVDHRSDLFSLGVVLYELITKQNPFKRESEAATLKAVSDDTPEPLARFKRDIPEGMQAIIDKALEKDVRTRYQHADGLCSDLMRVKRSLESTQTSITSAPVKKKSEALWWVAGSIVVMLAIVLWFTQRKSTEPVSDQPEKIMLAVLPFENLGDPEDEYFADGITREISSRLASIRSLGVIAHASAATYRNSDKPLAQIAGELGVDYILDGSIQWDKSGDTSTVRVAPQLIKVSDQTQAWASNYERALTRIFEVQANIAADIAQALGVKLAADERGQLSRMEQIDPVAYNHYLRAKQYFSWTDLDNPDIQAAEGTLLKAVALEPDFAEAHAMLATTHTALYRLLIDHTPERLAKARASIGKALELSPNLFETRLALGWFYYYGLERFDSARVAFESALEMEPDNSEAKGGLARVLRRFGLYDEALEGLRKAVRFDPRQAIYYREIAFTLVWSHRHAQALEYWDKALELEPVHRVAHGGKAYSVLHATGDPKKAREILYEVLETLPRFAALNYAEAEFFLFERKFDSALALLTGPDDVMDDFTMVDGPDSTAYYRLKGEIYLLKNDPDRARLYYDSARTFLEATPYTRSYHYTQTRADLAWIYARLGFSEQAVENAQLAVELSAGDKMTQGLYVYYQAAVYAMIGELEKAIDQLEHFLATPSWFSANWLRLDPVFDPLRDHPRFKALLEKYEKIYGT